MSKKNSNNNRELGAINRTLKIIISLEVALNVYAKADSTIRSLFNNAYKMLRAGASNQKIASVLKQIISIINQK